MRPRPAIVATAQLALGFSVVLAAERLLWAPPPGLPHVHPGIRVIRPPHDVWALAVAGDLVWAGGPQGLAAIARHSGTVRRADEVAVVPQSGPAAARASTRRPGAPDGLASMQEVRALFVDGGGALWIAHSGGVSRWAGGVLTTYARTPCGPLDPAVAIAPWHAGLFLVATEQDVLSFDGNTWRSLGAVTGTRLIGIDALHEDASQDIWLASSQFRSDGLYRYGHGRLRRFDMSDGLPHDAVSALAQDRQGTLWAATGFADRGGAALFDGKRWRALERHDGTPAGKVRSVFEDSHGRLWIGYEYEGVDVYDGRTFHRLTPWNGLAGWEVKQVVEDPDGVLWLATEDGVTRIDPGAVDAMFTMSGRSGA